MTEFQCLNPDFESDIRERLKRQFFMKLMDFDLTKIELGRVTGELRVEEKHMQQNYFVHGGAIATCSDIVMGFAAYSLLPKGYGVVTVDLNVQFHHPGIGDVLRAEGYVTKVGSNVSLCEADIFMLQDGKWKQTNKAFSTMYKVEANLNIGDPTKS